MSQRVLSLLASEVISPPPLCPSPFTFTPLFPTLLGVQSTCCFAHTLFPCYFHSPFSLPQHLSSACLCCNRSDHPPCLFQIHLLISPFILATDPFYNLCFQLQIHPDSSFFLSPFDSCCAQPCSAFATVTGRTRQPLNRRPARHMHRQVSNMLPAALSLVHDASYESRGS